MFEITANDRRIEAEPGETILSALTRAGIHVPTLCHMKKLTPTGACRICVVEVRGMPGLVPSCSTPVEAGMVISTNSPRVIEARKGASGAAIQNMNIMLGLDPLTGLVCKGGIDG